MKVKMEKILFMQEVYGSLKEKTLPIKTTYKVSKLFAKILEEAKFYEEQQQNLIEKYSKKNEDGSPLLTNDKKGIQIKDEYALKVLEKQKELLALEVELPDITFALEELETAELSVKEFNELMPFINDSDLE